MKKKLMILTWLFTMPVMVFGQTLVSGLTYQLSCPVAETNDFIDRLGLLGLGLEFRRFVNPNVSFGFSVNWNVLRQSGDDGDPFDLRVIKLLPLLIHSHIYVGRSKSFKPYLGIAAGAYNIHKREETQTAINVTDTWHFGVVPEIGFLLVTKGTFYTVFSMRYHYVFASGSVGHETYLSFGLGLLWAI